jgi:hypothetical protein
MSLRLRALIAALCCGVLVPLLVLDGAHADRRPDVPKGAHETSTAIPDPDYRLTRSPRSGQVLGLDGNSYPLAPIVVKGRKGMLFYGPDFDMACHYGTKLRKGLKHLAQLAQVIRKSGRRVVFTVAPNKSMVENRYIRRETLPHGACDTVGLQQQAKVLDHYSDRRYLPLRKLLVRSPVQAYWKTDPHWTTVGGSVYSGQLAAALDPRVAAAQRLVATTQTILGIFSESMASDATETAPAVEPGRGVKVRTAPGSTEWSGLPQLVTDHEWISTPARKTIKGRTLLIGDSFTQYALGTIRPIFRHGHFMWIGHFTRPDLLAALGSSRTVVIEVAQFLVQRSEMGSKDLRREVRRYLRHHPLKSS